MCDKFLAGDTSLRPNKRHFDLVVKAWHDSSLDEASQRMEETKELRRAVLGR